MKCNDLLYYMMRHFSVEFNLDVEGIPRQWVNLKPEEIKDLFVIVFIIQDKTKEKFLDMIPNFSEYQLKLEGEVETKAPKEFRPPTMGAVKTNNSKELMNSVEMISLRKKM